MAMAPRKLRTWRAWKSPKPNLRTTFAARMYSGKPGGCGRCCATLKWSRDSMKSSSSQSHGVRDSANHRLTAASRVAPMSVQLCRGVNGPGERSSDRHHSCSVNGTILAKSRGCMPGKPVRRRWALDLHGIRRLGTKDSGFSYQHSDGRSITDEKTLARIRRLRIPPAWREVRIARGESSPLQAVGVDKKGRTQYLYHPRFRAQREEEKFQRVVEFGESLPKLRRRVRADLKRTDLDR